MKKRFSTKIELSLFPWSITERTISTASFFHIVRPWLRPIGLRMAYDAGLDAGLDHCIYLVATIKRDSIWYSDNLSITRAMQFDTERKAFHAVLPKLDSWLKMVDID
jgi:hypothetical protein